MKNIKASWPASPSPIFKYAVLGIAGLLLAACTIVEPQPLAAAPPPGPVYASPAPAYYAAPYYPYGYYAYPPYPSASFSLGLGFHDWGHRGRWH